LQGYPMAVIGALLQADDPTFAAAQLGHAASIA